MLARDGIAALTALTALFAFAAAARRDLMFRLVPNWTSLTITASGLAIRLFSHDLPFGLIVAMLLLLCGLPLWRFGLIGGADVKLVVAGSLLFRPGAVPTYCEAIALAGGGLSVAYLALKYGPRIRSARSSIALLRCIRLEQRRATRGHPLPYAVAILGGVVCAMVDVR